MAKKTTFQKPEPQPVPFQSMEELIAFVSDSDLQKEYIETPKGIFRGQKLTEFPLVWFLVNWRKCARLMEPEAKVLWIATCIAKGEFPISLQFWQTYSRDKKELIERLEKEEVTNYVIQKIKCWESCDIQTNPSALYPKT